MLELRQVTKRFGRVLANDRVSLAVAPGTVHAIVGENGAGKSTAMRIAYGLYAPDAGEVVIDGRAVRLATPRDAIRLGVGMVHQHFMLVDTMTVRENVVLGDEPGNAFSLDLDAADARIRELSASLHLAADPGAPVERLSVGQQQKVEIVKALYRRARLLILDEPTAVLAPQDAAELFSALRRLKAQGTTVVLVTHKLEEVLAIADAVTVMRDGKVVGHRLAAETDAAELARLMVGRPVLLHVEKAKARPGETALAVRGLSVRSSVRSGDGARGGQHLSDVSFEVRSGEIVGVAGVEGNGQEELVLALAGLLDGAHGWEMAGEVALGGESLMGLDARRRRLRGMAHVPEDRQRRGLVLDFDLGENAVLGRHDRPPAVHGPGGVLLDRAAIERRAREIVSDFDIRPPDPALPARALSGGNQQKLVLGREVSPPPRLLLVAQPTRGVDIGAIERIHRRLIALRDQGCAILLVSSELEEVTALADRLLVVRGGRIVGEVDPATSSIEAIGLLMTGGGGGSGGSGGGDGRVEATP